jgi:hypothetical protein
MSAKSGDGLSTAVKQWPTPTCQDAENNGSPSQMARNTKPLNAAVKLWPTPNASDADKWSHESLAQRLEKGRQVRVNTAVSPEGGGGGSLNPTWVEWLMGWPLGWTGCAASATDKFRQWQRSHSKPSTPA